MSNDTEARIAAMKAIGEGVTKAVENASATLATFGTAFNAAYRAAEHDQYARIVRSMSTKR